MLAWIAADCLSKRAAAALAVNASLAITVAQIKPGRQSLSPELQLTDVIPAPFRPLIQNPSQSARFASQSKGWRQADVSCWRHADCVCII